MDMVRINPERYNIVNSHLLKNSRTPKVAVCLLAKIFTCIHKNSDEISETRSEIAQSLGVKPRNVSTIMTELEKINAVSRKQNGRGVVYYLNPLIATHRTGADRDKAQMRWGELNLEIIV